MAAKRKTESTSSAEETGQPSAEERQGMRGHEDGNVRPADGRYGLHKPSEESKYVRTENGDSDG